MWKTIVVVVVILISSCSRSKENGIKLGEELIKAVENNNVKMVKELLEKNVNPNYERKNKKALLKKIKYSHNKGGFFINMCNNDYRNSYYQERMISIFKLKQKELYKIFYSFPILIASKNNNLEIIKLLIKYGAKVNISSVYGTPLIVSVKHGNLDALKYLLKYKYFTNSNFDNEKINDELKILMRTSLICSNYNIISYLLKFMNRKNIKINDSKYYNLFVNYFDNINDMKLYRLFLNVYKQ